MVYNAKKYEEKGVKYVQLEVRCSNTKAQEFYREEAWKLFLRIDMYYKNEHGYMMKENYERLIQLKGYFLPCLPAYMEDFIVSDLLRLNGVINAVLLDSEGFTYR